MTVTLSQSETAAFPDRGSVGLLVSMGTGSGGQYLVHDLGSEQSLLHLRWLMNPATASGGWVILSFGFDAAGDQVFRVTYDATTKAISVNLATGDALAATLPSDLSWHAIELKIDTVGGNAALWINGVSVDTASGGFGSLTTRTVWLGGILKDANVSGDLYLDEWVIAQVYIGPVLVATSSDYADDPTRWLVVYNTADADSVAWSEHYRQARGVPFANLLGLNLPTAETIDAAQFASLDAAIGDYLNTNGLANRVLGVLLGYRVPGNVDFAGFGVLDAVPSLLHAAGSVPGTVSNPLALDGTPTRPTKALLNNLRLTARIDAPDLITANSIVDRATSLINTGLGNGANAMIWLDPYTTPGPLTDPLIESMAGWAQSIDRMRTRLPIQLSADTDPQQEVQFNEIQSDGFFWGWSAVTPSAGFFASPAGARVFCFQLHTSAATAPTLRDAQPTNWVDTAIAAGYASAAGSSNSYTLSAVPYVRPFFEALRQAWTLAEAWLVALPALREPLFLAGDPLMTVAMPRSGWDIFGPIDRLELLDPSTASLALRESELNATLPTTLQPSTDQDSLYLIRHLDPLGRSEAGARVIRAIAVGSIAAIPPSPPIWPDIENWGVLIEAGLVVVTIAWDRPTRASRVASLALEGQIDGGTEQTLTTFTPDPNAHLVQVQQLLPAVSARFRWRITTDENATMETPWSATIRPVAEPSIPLQPVEAGA